MSDSTMQTDSLEAKHGGVARILLKLSGEALAGHTGDARFGIDAKVLDNVCSEIYDSSTGQFSPSHRIPFFASEGAAVEMEQGKIGMICMLKGTG